MGRVGLTNGRRFGQVSYIDNCIEEGYYDRVQYSQLVVTLLKVLHLTVGVSCGS